MKAIPRFNRDFYSETDEFTYIGIGELGGKAQGLALIKEQIISHYRDQTFAPIVVNIPRLTVITAPFFHRFMEENDLYDIAYSDLSDERIAYHFLKAELPVDLVGDLRALITKYLKENKEWDLFMTVFIAIDEVQHHFWFHMDKKSIISESAETKKYCNAIRNIYEKSDEIIGDLIKNIDEDTPVIIMSDHGGTINSQGNLYLPNWLEKLGLANKKNVSGY